MKDAPIPLGNVKIGSDLIENRTPLKKAVRRRLMVGPDDEHDHPFLVLSLGNEGMPVPYLFAGTVLVGVCIL